MLLRGEGEEVTKTSAQKKTPKTGALPTATAAVRWVARGGTRQGTGRSVHPRSRPRVFSGVGSGDGMARSRGHAAPRDVRACEDKCGGTTIQFFQIFQNKTKKTKPQFKPRQKRAGGGDALFADTHRTSPAPSPFFSRLGELDVLVCLCVFFFRQRVPRAWGRGWSRCAVYLFYGRASLQ